MARPHSADLAEPIDATVYGFRQAADGWVARGDTFGVTANRDSIVLRPATPDAPSFRLRTGASAQGVRALEGGTLGRGPHERLRVGPDGLEQSWLFPTRPEREVEVRVAIDDVSLVDSTASGLHFAHRDGAMGLRYGHGTWIDAAGTRTHVEAEWEDEAVVLRVPEEVVRRSRFPALLDPTISPEIEIDVPVEYGPAFSRNSATAASSGSQHLVVWIDPDPWDSVVEHLYAQRVDASGTPLDGPGVILHSGYVFRAAVDFDGTNYVVFFLHSDGLRAMRVSPTGAVLDPAPGVLLQPEGGPLAVTFGGGFHFVTYHRTEAALGGVWIRRLRTDLTWEDPARVELSDRSTFESAQGTPAVAYGGGRVIVTWRSWRSSHLHQLARRFSATGVVEDAAPQLVHAIDSHELDQTGVAAASDGTDFLVAHSSNVNRLRVTRISAGGSVLDPESVDVAHGKEPALIWDGTSYVLGARDFVSSAVGWGYKVLRVDTTSGSVVAGSDVFLQTDGGLETIGAPLSFLSAGTPPLAGWKTDLPQYFAGCVFDPDAGCTGDAILSPGSNVQADPAVAWNGSAYLVGWQDTRFVDSGFYTLRVGPDGTPLDAMGTYIPPLGYARSPLRMIAHGTDWIFAWHQHISGSDYEVRAQRIDAGGALVGSSFVVPTHTLGSPVSWDIASDGSQLYVVWARSGVFGRRFALDGTSPDATPLAINASGRQPQLLGGPTGFQVAFEAGGTPPPPVMFARIRPDGTLVDDPAITVHSGSVRGLASDGTDFLVTWVDGRVAYTDGTHMQAARVRADGVVLDVGGGFDVSGAGASFAGALAFDGTDYVSVHDVGDELRLEHVTTTGTVVGGGPYSLTPRFEGGPAVASDGAGRTLVAYDRYMGGPHRNRRIALRLVSRFGTLGDPCASAADCGSGHCVDGVCCDSACGGTDPADCQACAVSAGASSDGVCSALAAGTECRSGTAPCDPAESCDGSALGCPIDARAPDGTDCDDGVVCNGADACAAGACVAGAAPLCDDGDVCTADSCAEPGGCAHAAIAGCCRDGTECDDGDVCTSDACTDSNVCEHAEVSGCCRVDGDCDDGDACTADACEAASGACRHDEIAGCCRGDTDCDDGAACTTARCDPSTSTCSAAPIAGCCSTDADCADADVCTLETCDVSDGTCAYEDMPTCCRAATDCDDGDACTTDVCTPGNVCEHVADGCPEPPPMADGCACRAGGRGDGTGAALIAIALSLVVSCRRRRGVR